MFRPPSSHNIEANDVSMLRTIIAVACLVWFVVVWFVCGIGFVQLFRYYWHRPSPAKCLTSLPPSQLPRVTVIRPVKGLDPRLYECLAASLRQTYPRDKINTVFCVSERADPAFPILERLCADFSDADVRILVEEEDPLLLKDAEALGPNPKIRNMSRAYREAKGDIVWILDCNVWVGKGVCGRLVDLLCGFGAEGEKKSRTKYKFVHQTPIVVDMDSQSMTLQERKELLGGRAAEEAAPVTENEASSRTKSNGTITTAKSTTPPKSTITTLLQRGGGRLDEAFLSSSHAKFYLAINTVAIAPCIIGKSTMFRRSQLNHITSSDPTRLPGIDYFSHNICEDHLIGDALWKLPQEFEEKGYTGEEKKENWGKHAMLFGDLCFQPISHTSVAAYLDRRIRWLRVRKFTVTLATFVEPGTECFLCGMYGAWAVTSLPFFAQVLGVPPTWGMFALFWCLNALLWCAVDYIQYLLLHSAKTVERDENTPDFAMPPTSLLPSTSPSPSNPSPASPSSSHADPTRQPLLASSNETKNTPNSHTTNHSYTQQPHLRDGARRSLKEFLVAWLGRESFALPIWIIAFWGGVSVEWRGRRFWVGLDMRVHEIVEEGKEGKKGGGKDGDREGNGKVMESGTDKTSAGVTNGEIRGRGKVKGR